MKIEVKNVGKVRQGTVDVSSVSVIAGSNGTGKSTVGRALMSFLSSIRRMDELVAKARFAIFITKLRGLLKLPILSRFEVLLSIPQDKYIGEWLNADKWDTPDKVKRFFAELSERVGSVHMLKHIEKMDVDVSAILSLLETVKASDERKEVVEILNKSFKSGFGRQLSPIFDHNAEGEIGVIIGDDGDANFSVRIKDDSVTDYVDPYHGIVPPVIYIEPLHILDISFSDSLYGRVIANRYDAGQYDMSFVISNTDYDVKYSDKEDFIAVKELVSELIEIVSGSLETDEREYDVKFHEKHGAGKDGFVRLMNLASGMKSISLLVHALRNGTVSRDSIVVIDEPESNLHPEWQVKFARMLVLLNKRLSVKVLLNTHSPYFLKAIEYYSEKYEITDVHFYNMVKEVNGVLYTVEECTQDTNRIFTEMYKPFEEIM